MSVSNEYPERLRLRDTGINDDLGGLGQRIYTTAGAGYHKVEYVRADKLTALDAENARLQSIINTPQSDDFLRATSTEAEHQRQRWGSDHDTGKTPADWFWLIGYLAGKALHAHAAGDVGKAEHHVITTAAACANWHRAMFGKTNMRPGIDAAMRGDGGEG